MMGQADQRETGRSSFAFRPAGRLYGERPLPIGKPPANGSNGFDGERGAPVRCWTGWRNRPERGIVSTALATTPRAPLTAADRCDRCGAPAYVRVTLAEGELLFCGHHFRQYDVELRKIALEVHDETGRLVGAEESSVERG